MTQIDSAGLVRRYLTAMEDRDLDAARAFLADDFVMNFPSALGMRTLEDLTTRSTQRYRFVKKTYDAFEVLPTDDGAVVYVRGALHGEWPDGAAFSGIRFIDRFALRADKIARQDVWNDLAEVRQI